ncbi:MAG TPA: peptide deformylase [bacterium]|nr:peptide deformylase [bacterium]
MIRKVYKDSDPVLRTPTEKVTDFGMEFQHLVDDMIETMRKSKGIGLAAPQVGISKKVFVAEFADNDTAPYKPFPLTVLVNPEVVFTSKSKVNLVEGCLSLPGLELIIKRPRKVTVKGQDRYGKPITITANDLYARTMQHEIDHLNSVLFIDRKQEIPVIFIGTGTLGIPALQLLAKDPQYKIKLVVTGKSTPTSRNENINIIEKTAKELSLPLLATNNIKDEKIVAKIAKTKPHLGIMADFGQIVPDSILEIPKLGVVNIHPSLLPRHRGASPVQQTILDGDDITGVTLLLTVSKMDAGPILSQAKVKLSQTETAPILKDYLAETGASLLLNTVPYYITGDIHPFEQTEEATYTHQFTKEDGFVDSTTPKELVERKIRAFAEWPKVHTKIGEKRIQLTAAHIDREGNLVIDRVRPEGKKEMSYDEFQRGYRTTLTFS